MKRTRVCVLHLNSHVARTKPGITGEALAVMFADCLHYQVDFMDGDANMAAYRYAGGKQVSMFIQESAYQRMLRHFLKAARRARGGDIHTSPTAQHVTSHPSDILRLYEETFNRRAADLPNIDWASFPTLDCLVFTALQWGRSYRAEQWEQLTAEKQEYKITISERLMVTTNEHYLLDPADADSHCPLRVKVEPTTTSEPEMKEYKTIEGTYKRAVARKERQKANKAKGKARPAP